MNGVTKAPGSPPANQKQFVLINLLKAGSAQLIVLHHLAFYGPMSDHARTVMPSLIDWLYDYARIAVQVFLVIGGFLAAKSLSSQGPAGIDHPLKIIWRRYMKLAPPFIVAMLLAVLASAVAAAWMTDDSISPPPTIGQLWAHIFLLHGVLGYESLSAGAWYVAIDFQLYALMALLLWLPSRFASKQAQAWLAPVLVAIGVIASLLYFNRDADWDVWAPYFFGSYGLGALAWWASDPKRTHGAVTLLLLMMVLPAVLALGVDFRSRIAVAAVVACVLFLFGRARLTTCEGGVLGMVNGLAKISFSVFLVHFPVCLVVNAVFTRFVSEQPQVQALGMLVAWGTSLWVGKVFFYWVEKPLSQAMALSQRPVVVSPLAKKNVRVTG